MTAGIRDLHLNHPGAYLTGVETSCDQLWENNRYVSKLEGEQIETDRMSGIKIAWAGNKIPTVKLEYPLVHKSNTGPNHFTEGYTDHLETLLDVRIRNRLMRGHIELSEQEKSWMPQVQELTGRDLSYWIVANGGKADFTAKWWDPVRMQGVVSSLKQLTFVQVGSPEHHHVLLYGSNVINLIGKTDLRQLIRLIYHSSGVICPVTLFMHLAAAVPVRRDRTYGRLNRPCVVIAGGREPSTWEAYCNHQYLHVCGMLLCCDNGGCWKSRVVPLNDGDSNDKSLCLDPVVTENGITIPRCLKMITVQNVIEAVEKYLP